MEFYSRLFSGLCPAACSHAFRSRSALAFFGAACVLTTYFLMGQGARADTPLWQIGSVDGFHRQALLRVQAGKVIAHDAEQEVRIDTLQL